MTPAQQDKLDEFKAIREAVGKTTLLSSILDESWFEALENEMANSSTTGVCAVDPSGLFDSLCHPLRGALWFEAVQYLFLAGRPIFIEATNTTQEVIPRFTGSTRVMAVDTDCQIKQIVKKLRKKIAEGRQLALAKGSPTLLFLALTPYGADRRLAEIMVNECFRTDEFAALSGVVLSDSWKFQITSWHPGVKPDTPLT